MSVKPCNERNICLQLRLCFVIYFISKAALTTDLLLVMELFDFLVRQHRLSIACNGAIQAPGLTDQESGQNELIPDVF